MSPELLEGDLGSQILSKAAVHDCLGSEARTPHLLHPSDSGSLCGFCLSMRLQGWISSVCSSRSPLHPSLPSSVPRRLTCTTASSGFQMGPVGQHQKETQRKEDSEAGISIPLSSSGVSPVSAQWAPPRSTVSPGSGDCSLPLVILV